MVCTLCSVDKEPCLFSPYALRSPWPSQRVCRKCLCERKGAIFGVNNGIRKGQAVILRAERYGNKVAKAKAEGHAEEQRRLLEARKARLARGA